MPVDLVFEYAIILARRIFLAHAASRASLAATAQFERRTAPTLPLSATALAARRNSYCIRRFEHLADVCNQITLRSIFE